MPAVFVDSDIESLKSFEINCLLNKRMIKKVKDLIIEHLVCWTSYSSKWDKWYNMENVDNIAKLIHEYEKCLAQQRQWLLFLSKERLLRFYLF